MSESEIKQSITEWEKQKGMMLHGEIHEGEPISEEGFMNMAKAAGFTGVDYESRTKFLKDNGYELTRRNYMSGELSAKPKEEK